MFEDLHRFIFGNFSIIFVCMFVGVSFVLSRLAMWPKLTQKYPLKRTQPHDKGNLQKSKRSAIHL